MADQGDVRIERRDDGVAIATLDRPEKRNALSIHLRFALADAMEALAADEDVRAIVLTGAGTAFCAGMDITQSGGDRDHKQALFDSSVRCFDAVARCPTPTVAAVNGPAIAGGFALALLCDLRVAGPGASFGFPEVGRHIPPSYGAALAALPPAVARDLCLTGRVVEAREALTLGVVVRLGPLDEAVGLAAEIAAHERHATREVKRRVLRAGEATWLAQLAEEQAQLRAHLLPDQAEPQ